MKNRKIILLVVSILGVIGIVFGLSYAWFVLVIQGNETNTLKTGELKLILDESGSAISLIDAFPATDEEGMLGTPFTFSLENTGNKNVIYDLKLVYDESSCKNCKKMDASAVKFSLTKNGNRFDAKNLGKSNSLLEYGLLNHNETNTYELRIWIDENAGNEVQNAYFYGKLEIVARQSADIPSESCFVFSEGTITDYNSQCTKNVVIPSTISGVNVTAIGDAAFRSKGLSSVVIPEGVLSIGKEAFRNNQLSTVVLPEGMQSIAGAAFVRNQLTQLIIPKSVTTLGTHVFNDNLLPDQDAFIYQRNSDGSIDSTYVIGYAGARRDNVVIPGNVKKISAYSFHTNQLTSVVIPDGVEFIGNRAFYFNQLTDITIPSSVTAIGEGAFASNSLTSVKIKGKANSGAFQTYGANLFGWATGYSDSNITWNG